MQVIYLWLAGTRSTTVPPGSLELPGLAMMVWQRGSARTGTDQAIRILRYCPAPLPSGFKSPSDARLTWRNA